MWQSHLMIEMVPCGLEKAGKGRWQDDQSGHRKHHSDIRDHHRRHRHRHHDDGDADVMLSMPAVIIAGGGHADPPSARFWANICTGLVREFRNSRGSGTRNVRKDLILLGKAAGAGEGNRTLVCSLGSCRSTIELRPHAQTLSTFFRIG